MSLYFICRAGNFRARPLLASTYPAPKHSVLSQHARYYGHWHPADVDEKRDDSKKHIRTRNATSMNSPVAKRPSSSSRAHLELLSGAEAIQRQSPMSENASSSPKLSQPELSANQRFRRIPVDSKLWAYIERNQFGRRKVRKQPNNRKLDRKGRLLQVAKASSSQRGQVDDASEKAILDSADAFFLRKNRLKAFVSASSERDFPADKEVPEVAVIGRSNVGKSSLINALSDTTIVKVSDRPGETRAIDWYRLGSEFSLVDLPGYGFAYADQSQLENWKSLIRNYLSTRKSLRRTLLLIDSRIGLKPSDLEMMSFLDSINVTYQVVLTKSDLVTPADLGRRASLVKAKLDTRRHGIKQIVIVSARTRQGIPHLRSHLLGLADIKFHGKAVAASNKRSQHKDPAVLPETQHSSHSRTQAAQRRMNPSSEPKLETTRISRHRYRKP